MMDAMHGGSFGSAFSGGLMAWGCDMAKADDVLEHVKVTKSDIDDEDVEEELPPLMNGRGQRGGRRGKHRKYSTGGKVQQIHLNKVPFMWTAGDVGSVFDCIAKDLLGVPIELKDVTQYRSRYGGKPMERVASNPSATSATLCDAQDILTLCTASVCYVGPPIPNLPISVPIDLADAKYIPPAEAAAGVEHHQLVLDQSSHVTLPPKLEPVLTLYGKAYTLDGEPPPGKALPMVLAFIHKISKRACSYVKLMSLVSASRHSKVSNVHLIQFLVECDTLQQAEFIHETINERKVDCHGQMYLFSVEYTSERTSGAEKEGMYKPLYVPRDQREKLPSEWCSDVLHLREDRAQQTEMVRKVIEKMGPLPVWKGVQSPVTSTPVTHAGNPVQEFPTVPISIPVASRDKHHLKGWQSPCSSLGGGMATWSPSSGQNSMSVLDFPNEPPAYHCRDPDAAPQHSTLPLNSSLVHNGSFSSNRGGGGSMPLSGSVPQASLFNLPAAAHPVVGSHGKDTFCGREARSPNAAELDPRDAGSFAHRQAQAAATNGAPPAAKNNINEMSKLISAALSTVSRSVDLPWNQTSAVMMGAAAYAVACGHWTGGNPAAAAPTSSHDTEQLWKQLVAQLQIPLPPSNTVSQPMPIPHANPGAPQAVLKSPGDRPSATPPTYLTPPNLRLPKYQRKGYHGSPQSLPQWQPPC